MKSMKKEPMQTSTKGVKTLLGDPKGAIIRLSIPMIIAMSVQTLYNLADAFWVSGLGADALAAVGFFFPFFFLIMAVSNGLGIGGGAAVSRYIGSHDKKGADSAATHTIILMLIIAAVLTFPLYSFSGPLFSMLGAGQTLPLAVDYAQIIFACMIFFFFSNVANALLRAEGDAKKAMIAMIFGALLNIFLDPIFIYAFGMGVSGAAWATIVSVAISSVMLFHWFFLHDHLYLSVKLRGFRFKRHVIKDIFRVGFPATVQHAIMSISILVLNLIIVMVGGTDGVAILTTGWRVSMFAILPLFGIATAVVSVTGAAYGQKDFKKLNSAFMYAVKIGLIIEFFLAFLVFFLAPAITAAFTQAENTARIAEGMIVFMQIIALYFPFTAFGMISSSMFQGTGKGMSALIVTMIRTVFFTIPFAWIFAFNLGWGIVGVWYGLVLSNIAGAIIAFMWAKKCINNFGKERKVCL